MNEQFNLKIPLYDNGNTKHHIYKTFTPLKL